jgi:hypothetical protein
MVDLVDRSAQVSTSPAHEWRRRSSALDRRVPLRECRITVAGAPTAMYPRDYTRAIS